MVIQLQGQAAEKRTGLDSIQEPKLLSEPQGDEVEKSANNGASFTKCVHYSATSAMSALPLLQLS